MSAPTPCRVCDQVNQIELIELDTLMGDPAAWPASVWGDVFEPPRELTPGYRRYGAVEMGLAWLAKNGYAGLTTRDVRKHYRWDVPKIAANPDDLVSTGLIARGNTSTGVATIDPLKYIEYYNQGIEAGIEGLKIIRERIATLKAAGVEIPLSLVKMAVDAGAKLAMSQAAIKAAGRNFGDESDPDDGFRIGSSPPASDRMGHHRVRVVDGEARPIRDVGPADRSTYNDRARQEGGPELPAP